ncbi:MAG: hypothetical protein R2774_02105 [Saprospiraceae bacterium]
MIKLYYFSILVLFTTSCASVSQYQTAKPMGEDNISHRISLNGNVQENGEGAILPFIAEYGINYGVTSNLDIIGKLNMFGSWSIGGKYSFLGGEGSNTYLAIGPTMNYFGKILNFTVPLHFTIEPNDVFSFTLTPSYTTPGLYKIDENSNKYYRDINSGFIGLSPYIEVGKKVKFIFGCNLTFSNSHTYTDFGFGVKFNNFASMKD